MTEAFLIAAVWVLAVNAMSLMSSRSERDVALIVSIGTGIPILGLITLQHGPLAGLISLVAGMAVLAWPVARLRVRLRRKSQQRQARQARRV